MKKKRFPRLAVIAVAALVAASTFSSAIYAAVNYTPLLNLKQDWPQILFDSTGRTKYVASTQLLTVDASALYIQFADDPESAPFQIEAIGDPFSFGTLKIRARVDHTGKLVGGIPPGDPNDACGGINGDDFCITGVTLDGTFQGVLLSGEVVNFASRDGGSDADDFEFHIKITGGVLASQYASGYVVVPVASEVLPGATPFDGSFNADFEGRAKGTAGETDPFVAAEPPPPPPPPPSCATDPTLCAPPPSCATDPSLCAPPPSCATDPSLCPPPPPPVVSGTDQVAEATSSAGAVVTFNVVATDYTGAILPVMCTQASGTVFPLGQTLVTCTSAPDSSFFHQTGHLTFRVTVQDTTPPTIIGSNVVVQADGPHGQSSVPLPVTATDLVDGPVAVVCDPVSGSAFPIGVTSVMCTAHDAAGNLATRIDIGATELAAYITVTVIANPPALPGGDCFVVNFREVTYFKGQSVITSWPYRASGGAGYTKSRGTLYRIYGFQPSELGQLVRNVDDTWTTYTVKYDIDVKGYYVDLGGPARVMVCPAQLHQYVLAGQKGNGHTDGSTLLPISQQNVPGIMLTHNTQIVKLPSHIRAELSQLKLWQGVRGVIDYIGFQLQGNGSADFREFVDVEVQFPGDSATDRLQHYKVGFLTAINTNFESFAGCNYIDYSPGNDAVRLHDVWGPNRSTKQGYASWQACGTREPAVNQKRRANYDVPFNAVQILPTVNVGTDTLRLFYGAIRPIPATEMKKKDLKGDWDEWDRWDN